MGTEGSESYDDVYIDVEVTVPAREGRCYRFRLSEGSVSDLWSIGFIDGLTAWLREVRADLERGDRTS